MIKKIFGIVALALLWVSCDKDFNTIGSDIVGDEHFGMSVDSVASLAFYNKVVTGAQTDNLIVNPLGVYKDPYFGETKAHFLTQVSLSGTNVDYLESIGANPTIQSATDSVYVYIPFFATVESTDDSGNNTYSLDSIYGGENKVKISVYHNNYHNSRLDTGGDTKNHYNDAETFTLIDGQKDELLAQEEILFDKSEIKIYKKNQTGDYLDSNGSITTDATKYVIKERKTPGIWINLSKTFFQQKVLDAAAQGKLYNNSVFKEHFRSLYIKSDLVDGKGAMALLDFSKAYIIVQYHSLLSSGTEITKNTLKLPLTTNTISLTENNFSSDYTTGLNSTSNERIYLKGGTGSITYIDLFTPQELTYYKEQVNKSNGNGWMINEASITFYIDQTAMANADQKEPLRIYLFDATNNTTLVDYYSDATTINAYNGQYSKYVYGGIIEKNSTNKGTKYKIRLTNLIKSILENSDTSDTDDTENVRLGLCISHNIGIANFYELRNPITVAGTEHKKIPLANVLSPIGTVLYGSGYSDVNKRPKLKIYFTKPD